MMECNCGFLNSYTIIFKCILGLTLCMTVIYLIAEFYSPNSTEIIQARIYLSSKECESPIKIPKQLLPSVKSIPTDENGFPMIVHHIFGFWDSEMKDEWKNNLKSCEENTPGLLHVMWNKTMAVDLIQTHYSWFMTTFESYQYEVQRTDAARYFIIYHYGGMYLDMDIKCSSKWKQIYKDVPKETDLVLVSGDPDGVTNYFLLAKPCNNFLRYMFTRMGFDNHWYVIRYATVMMTTGPRYVSWKLDDFQCGSDNQLMPKMSLYIIPFKTFWTNYFIRIGHHGAGSWYGWEGRLLIYLYDRLLLFIFIGIVFIAMLILFLLRMVCLYRKRESSQKRTAPL